MDVVVVGKHTEIDAALRALTVERVQRITKFANDVRRVDVDYEQLPTRRAEDSHACEILVHVRQHLVKGTAAATEHVIALERALDKVEEQMRRLHERRVGRRNGTRARGARTAAAPAETATIVEVRRLRRRRRRPRQRRRAGRREEQAVRREADGRRGGRAADGPARSRLLPVHPRRLRPGCRHLPPARRSARSHRGERVICGVHDRTSGRVADTRPPGGSARAVPPGCPPRARGRVRHRSRRRVIRRARRGRPHRRAGPGSRADGRAHARRVGHRGDAPCARWCRA